MFSALLDATLGDSVDVTDSDGRHHAYVVTSRVQISRTALPAHLFGRTVPRQLVLITCGGRNDRTAHHYDDLASWRAPSDPLKYSSFWAGVNRRRRTGPPTRGGEPLITPSSATASTS